MIKKLTVRERMFRFIYENFKWCFRIIITMCSLAFLVDLYTILTTDRVASPLIGMAIQGTCIWLNIKNYKRFNFYKEDAQGIMEHLTTTLLDVTWLYENEAKVRELLPDTWTHIDNVDIASIAHGLKSLGVNWQNEEWAAHSVHTLKMLGILQREGHTMRRNPRSLFYRPPLTIENQP